jgi:biotin carboxylase
MLTLTEMLRGLGSLLPSFDEMRTVLILGGGLTQCDAIARARALGLRAVVVDGNREAPGMRLDDPAVVPIPISFAEIDAVVEALGRRGLAVDAVLPYGSDQSVLPATRIASRLGLASIGEATAIACTDKVEMRRRWARAGGIPLLPHAVATDAAAARREALAIGLPVVVKPPDNAAQRGVQLVSDAARLEDAAVEALDSSPSGRVLIERFVDGPEIAVTTFTANGETRVIQVTDRVTGPPPYLGICLAHVFPTQISPGDLAAVEEVLPRAAEALGVRAGPTYSQVRLQGGGPFVLETGARLGGGRDSELRSILSGQDPIGVHLRQLLGDPVDPCAELDPGAISGGGCVRFLTPPSGRLLAVHGLEAARASPGARSVALFIEPGQTIPPLHSGAARAGYVIAAGRDRAEAVDRAEHAAALVRFEME